MKPKSTLRHFLLLAGSSLLAISSASADTLYWDVDGTTDGFSTVVGTWNTTNDFWNTDATGGNGGSLTNTTTAADDLIIAQATTNTGSITVSGTQNASSITFAPNVGPTTNITGGTAIVIGGSGTYSGILQQSSGANTVSTALTLDAANTAFEFSNSSSGLLTLSGVITGGASATQTVTIGSSDSGDITLSNNIVNGAGGTVALDINSGGAGVTTLSGNSSFSGGVTLNAGTLRANTSVNALGQGTVTLNGGILDFNHGTTLAITRPTTIGGNVTIITQGGNSTLGALSQTGAGWTITKEGAGTLILGATADVSFTGSTIDVTNGNLEPVSAGRLSSGTTENATTVKVSDTGVLISGNNANVFRSSGTGTPNQLIDLNGGKLRLTSFDTRNYGGNLHVTNGGILTVERGSANTGKTHTMNSLRLSSGTVSIEQPDGTSSQTLVFTNGTTVDGNATLDSTATGTHAVIVTLNAMSIGAHTLTTQGPSAITAGATTLSGAATFSAGGPGLLTLGAVTGGVHDFTKSGAGVLNLSAAGSGSGTYTVNGGVLLASNASSLPGGIGVTGGTSALTLNGGVYEIGSATTFARNLGTGVTEFQITGGESGFSAFGGARTVTVNNNAATVVQWDSATFAPTTFVLNAATANNTLAFTNRLDLNGDGVATTRNVAVMANTATLSGIIENLGGSPIGLTKSGAGTLVLSNAANDYDGDTTVSGGTLTLGASGALPSGNNVVLAGGTLNSGTATNTAGTLTLSADSTIALGGGSLSFASAVGDWIADDVTLTLTGTLGPNSLKFGTDATGLSANQLARTTYFLLSGAGKTVTLDAEGYVSSPSYDGNWSGTTGNWSNTGIWTSNIIADGQDATLTTSALGANTRTLTLDSNRSVGTITVNAGSSGHAIFASSGGSKLDLDVSSGTPTIKTLSRFAKITISADLTGDNGLQTGFHTGSDPNGTIVLSGNNDYTGGTNLTYGTVLVGHANALSTGTITFGGGGLASNDATNYSLANTIELTGNVIIGRGNASNPAAGTGNLSFTDTAATALGATRTFTVDTGLKATFAQAFSGATFGITKAGTGTLELTNASTYTGTTTVSAGTLILSGSNNSAGATSVGAGTLQLNSATNGGLASGTVTTTGIIQALGADRVISNVFSLSGTATFSGAFSIESNAQMSSGGDANRTIINNIDAGKTLTIAGYTTGGNNRSVFFQGTGTTIVDGNISLGTGAIDKTGAGKVILQGTLGNGDILVKAGIVNIQNAGAFGTTSKATVVSANAALEIQGNLTVGAEPINLNGTGISDGGALRNISGNNSLAGLITLQSATRINSDADLLTLDVASGNAITGTFDLTFGGAGNTTVADNINISTGILTKDGGGTLTLSGTNTYTGATTVSAGTLAVTGSLGATAVSVNAGTLSGNGDFGGNVTIASGATHALAVADEDVNQDTTVITGTLAMADSILDLTAAVAPDDGVYVLATATVGITGFPATINYNSIAGTVSVDTVSNPKRLLLTVSSGGGDPEIAVEEPATFDIVNGGSRDFGTVTIGSNNSLTFTIRNTGTADLNLTGTPLVAVSGTNAGDFTVTAVPTTPVAASATTTFTVQFAPGGAGVRNAVLTIANNDSDENPFTINVSGTGQTAYEDWAGGAAFGNDENGDGVSNGLAFLLGASGPNVSALGLLPTVSENNGALVLTFSMRNTANRGTAALSVEHSSDLGNADTWEAALVPNTSQTVNDVEFVITGGDPLNGVVATIPASKAAASKLFGRLKATE